MIFAEVSTALLKEVEILEITERNEGGFGHTGKV
jgi:dUTPase